MSLYRKLDKTVTFGGKLEAEDLAEDSPALLPESCSYELIMCKGLTPEEVASLFAGNP